MASMPATGLTGYTHGGPTQALVGGSGPFDPGSPSNEQGRYWTNDRKKRAYSDFLGNKAAEIREQMLSRRYRHGVQWDSSQVKIFNDRKQPVITFNKCGPKIDGIIGVVERLRREPKAYPKSPRFQDGADLATAALRSCLQQNKWEWNSPWAAETGAVDGIGGMELMLEQGRDGYEVVLVPVDIDGFFYDPRSKKHDFSDASYMGCGKWVDAEMLKDRYPQFAKEIDASIGHGYELTANSDADASVWTGTGGNLKTVRLVYICYQHRGTWCWGLFTGYATLMEGESYFVGTDNKPICSYIMYSNAVDQDNDRYGFIRNLKGPQDEVNQRRSKGLHEQNTRRIVGEVGAFDDIEKARREAVRPDGVVLRNKGYEAEFDDNKKLQDVAGQLKFYETAVSEIANFGPNAPLLGSDSISNRSGRAISLMQQQGLAELGPYLISYSNWKLRIYEAVFCAIKRYWTNERWIRVSDDDGMVQMVQINALQMGPGGMPQVVNNIGQLDVDIVLDEGPDTVTLQQDLFENLAQIIPAVAPMLKPAELQVVIEMLFEVSNLPAQVKRKFRQAAEQGKQPDPAQQAAQQLQLQGVQAQIEELKSKAMLNVAKAQAEGMPDQQKMPEAQKFELPPVVQVQQALAGIDKTRAESLHKLALAGGEQRTGKLDMLDLVQKAEQAAHTRVYDAFDLGMRKYEADSARQRPNSNA
jgi:hypothetical protein